MENIKEIKYFIRAIKQVYFNKIETIIFQKNLKVEI